MEPVKHDYITRRAHGDHPEGSLCKAWWNYFLIWLEYSDGSVIELDRCRYYLEGLLPNGSFENGLFDILSKQAQSEIDQEILGEVFGK